MLVIISVYNINMSKYILLVLSLILLISISIYAGMWMTCTTMEGAATMDASNPAPVTLPNAATVSGPAITPLVDTTKIASKTKYNSDNLNVEYHDDLQATGANHIYNTQMGKEKVYDVKGNLVDVVSNAVQGKIVYYQPGSYKYGATSYVPYYEDSVFLSRSTNAVVNTPTYVTSNNGGGFCNKYNNDHIKIEQQCNAINNETCAATTCCVLLGGQKCVAGTENGPIMKDNYSDFMIANKDLYYYQGKCYGNCPNTPQFHFPTLPEKLPYMPPVPGPVPSPVPNPVPNPVPDMHVGYPNMPPLVTSIPPPPINTFAQ
jgi:hypothetical protein